MAGVPAGLSREAADAGVRAAAVAFQWVADVQRHSTALWERAASARDPHGRFLHHGGNPLRSVVATAFPTLVPTGGTEIVAWLRRTFSASCATNELNVLVVFDPTVHLTSDEVDLAGGHRSVLRGRDPRPVEADLLATARVGGVDGMLMAARAYVVETADRTDNTWMLAAFARAALLEQAAAPCAAPDAARVAIVGVLGPVEVIRFRPFLTRGGRGSSRR